MWTFSTLFALANVVVAQTGDADVQRRESYGAVMSVQYAARAEPVAQRPEEAKRIYDAYLNSIGQKLTSEPDNHPGNAGDQSR
jgi:hypothetical protein